MKKRLFLIVCFIAWVWQISAQTSRYIRPSIHLGKNHTVEKVQDALERTFQQERKKTGELSFVHKTESPASTQYTFQQLFQGIPIYQGGLTAIVDKKGSVRAILENLQLIPQEAPASFSLALSDLSQRMAETYGAYETKGKPMFFLHKEKLIPIFHLTCYAHSSSYTFEVLIDAQSGEELSWKSLDLHLKPTSAVKITGDTSAKGRVFIPNPCTQAQVNYGDLFIDSMDFHKSIFTTLMDTVTLQDLCIEEDSFRLKGPYVEIKDLEGPAIKPVASKEGKFFFNRDEYGFEQVMAYYHIDRFQRKIRALGFKNLSDGPILVDPQGILSDNSVTTIRDSMPVLLFGLGGVDDAEDADVIIHEYGHALSFYASKGRAASGNVERLGLEEGIGDYLAAIYSQDMGYDNWPLLFNWDGHNEFWSGRIANSPGTYPPDDTTIYTLGSIWASSILELRELIGKSTVDSLFFQELYMNTETTTLPQAAQLFLLADSLLFGGMHTEEISFSFCERGLIQTQSSNCAVVSNHGLAPLPSISIFPNPGAGEITLDIQGTNSTLSCTLVNSLGQAVYSQKVHPGINHLELSGLATGVYFVQILEKDHFLISEKIVIQPKN